MCNNSSSIIKKSWDEPTAEILSSRAGSLGHSTCRECKIKSLRCGEATTRACLMSKTARYSNTGGVIRHPAPFTGTPAGCSVVLTPCERGRFASLHLFNEANTCKIVRRASLPPPLSVSALEPREYKKKNTRHDSTLGKVVRRVRGLFHRGVAAFLSRENINNLHIRDSSVCLGLLAGRERNRDATPQDLRSTQEGSTLALTWRCLLSVLVGAG